MLAFILLLLNLNGIYVIIVMVINDSFASHYLSLPHFFTFSQSAFSIYLLLPAVFREAVLLKPMSWLTRVQFLNCFSCPLSRSRAWLLSFAFVRTKPVTQLQPISVSLTRTNSIWLIANLVKLYVPGVPVWYFAFREWLQGLTNDFE